jgi:hypothetical protein
MLDSKLFKLMQVLSAKELLVVEKYLASPFLNPYADVTKLFVQICKYYPSFESPKLAKDRLHHVLYGDKAYNDNKMRKLMAQLSRLIEQYLVQRELKNSDELQAKLLAKALGDSSSYGLFLETIEARLKKLDKSDDRGRNYFREGYELCELVFFHPESDKLSNRNDYLHRAIGDFERYFTLVTLQNQADNIVRSRLVRGQEIGQYIERAKFLADKPAFEAFNSIRLFRQIVSLLEGQNVDDLERLKSYAFETFNQLSRFEQDFAINLLRNFAIPTANQGSLEYMRFIFELYKFEIERGFFANTINSGTFMNITSLSLAIGELDWAVYFVDKFNQLLPNNEKETTFGYCMGLVFYHKGLLSNQLEDYYKALQHINLIPLRSGAKYDLRVRPTLLRINFEIFRKGKETLDELLSQVKNFERHLTNSGVYSEPVQEFYLNFLRYFKSLARLASRPDIKNVSIVNYLKKLDEDEASFAYRNWLIEKGKGLVNTN